MDHPSSSSLTTSDSEEDDFEFCYRFRPLYADEAGRGQEEEEAPWMSGSGIYLPTRSADKMPSVGAKGSISDGCVTTLLQLEHRGAKKKEGGAAGTRGDGTEAKGKEREHDEQQKNEDEDEDARQRAKKNEREMKAAAKRNSAPPSTHLGMARLETTRSGGPSPSTETEERAGVVDSSLLITDEDERETMTITRAQWKRWQHQEAYVVALTRELERLRQQMAGLQLPTPRPAQGESDKDQKMREFKEMMAARYSNIRTNAEGHKAQVIVDYYANRLEQRQKNVRARARGGSMIDENGSGSTPSSTPRGKPAKGKSKKGRESLSPSLGSSSSGSSLLARFKNKP